MKKNYFLIFLFLFGLSTAMAQVTTSTMSGLVKDDQGITLPGANVVATHTPTGSVYGAMTNMDGRFRLNNMRIGGPYKVEISYVGFETKTIENINLDLGETYNIEVTLMTTSNALDEVLITVSDNPTFSSERTGAATQITSKDLKRLPTISRSAQDFTRLEPSASGNSFGGRNDQFNNFSLDGAVFNNPFGLDSPTPGGQTGAQPISLDAIEQIKVTTAPYDVTLSGFTGASVNAVTKSGDNTFNATAYSFFRNENLTGGQIEGQDVPRNDLEQVQYGVSVGGPIVENKLFFFANFEKDDRTDLGSPFAPNRGTGAINESRVLASDMSAVSNALADLGYDTGRFENFNYNSESTKGIIKLDWNINQNHKAALIYNFLRASKDNPANRTALGFRGPSPSVIQFENSGYEINNNLNSVQFELNSSFGNKYSNKFQAGYTYFDDFRNPFSTPAPPITIQDGSGSNYIIAGHEPFSINNELQQKVFQVTNNFNIFVGDHSITIGAAFERFEFDNSFNLAGYDNFGNPNGYYGTFRAYPSVEAFLTDANAGSQSAIARNLTYAQGVFESRNANGVGNDGGWRLSETNVGQLSFYAQDEWSMTNNFKLTYGIRFDKPMYFDTDEKIQEFIDTDNGATVDPTTVYYDPETNSETTLNSTQLPTDEFLISPRLGFNWDVRNDKTFQIRGGSGVFTGRLPFVWIGNQVSGADQGFFQIVDPDFKFPQVWRSNLGVDYKFENGIIASTDISYTEDINAAHVQNWGLKEPSQTLAGVDNRATYAAADKGANNAYVFTNSDKGRIFNAVGTLKKYFDNGLYVSASYSYLNAKDVNSIEAEITGDAFTFNPTVGNANTDVLGFSKYGDTHRFIAVVSKNWQYGSQKQWQTTVSSFIEYAKGGRYNYTYGGDINNDGSNINDLLYIPTEQELLLMQFSGPGQADAFNAFIENNDYMSENRGSYFERYGALAPWRSTVDLKVLQDYNFKVSDDKTNTIQLSLDILNFGNLINSDWGIVQEPFNQQPIGVSVDPQTNEPTYTFNTNRTDSFAVNTSLISRWRMQVGLRYIF
ncbi:carboxypeptidase regulatory-like domain-containing protein [Psychroflexus sp. CAK1W]|uniref:TonB-dependent receptor n=1 Tax=Psychroflexus curvus TaxID=2873595 RepID=UPI001CD02F2A|nr:carboxypeptidase regulatory-like domain-containing protein [Psychroflexus curvus]MBZ9626855.1 carboxypeptidase regulatory-like domain-containing protein [Psychroflexus curvus]